MSRDVSGLEDITFRVILYKMLPKGPAKQDIWANSDSGEIGFDARVKDSSPLFEDAEGAEEAGRAALNEIEDADGFVVYQCESVLQKTRKDIAN